MRLQLERLQKDLDVTIGSLSIDGDWECWICEDTVREVPGQPVSAWKVKTATAIPFGTYEIDITMSARFGKQLPLLLNVPGFDGIRIHPGNTAADTDGCLLPGADRLAKSVGHSVKAFDQLFARLRAAKSLGQKIFIEIV
jgi:hypothetical protein